MEEEEGGKTLAMGNRCAAGLGGKCGGAMQQGIHSQDSNTVGGVLDDAVTQSRLNHHNSSDVAGRALYDFVDYDNSGFLINANSKVNASFRAMKLRN